ncbi:MAG: carboxypeptidase-like regulatory domain-containing protein [Minisyncoccia bacterium]
MLPRARAFSLIDVVVGVALLLVLFMALFGVLRASLVLSTVAKAQAAAVELANTQMEYLRGLSYDSLGTVGGIPSGAVPQYATSTVDGIQYVTRTYVEYYDDPADGIGVNDSNGVTTDYKVGKVTVSYSYEGLAKSIVLVSNFVPPGLESSTGGGTLVLHIVGAAGQNLSDASVQIVNASTTPAVNFTTFSDTSGLVMIGGAATSSMYQIYVSRSGYSSAQTYARAGQNVNPTPGYLTVVKNQTTSATFAIDQLSSLTLSSFSPATTTAFSDLFSNASNLASQTNTQVAGGALTLASQALSGNAHSISIAPNALAGWGILSATISTPNGTTAVIRVDDASGNPVPDAMLPGNAAGFSSFPISLTAIATSTYPALTLEADLTSNATTTTSSILDWSLSYTQGLLALSNVSFTLTGAKTIGTNGSGLPIYKTIVNDTTGATGTVTEPLEWDAYTLGLGGGNLIEACPSSPISLMPAQASSTALIVGQPTQNTLLAAIQDGSHNVISGARVTLAKAGYAATVPTSACGLAYFGGLAAGTYSASVSAAGHTTTVFPNISVAGHATTTLTLP